MKKFILIALILLTTQAYEARAAFNQLDATMHIENIKSDIQYFSNFSKSSLGNFITVGSNGSCDYPTIFEGLQDANLNFIEEIRVTNDKIYNENLVVLIDNPINLPNLKIRGGFNNCDEANNNIQSNTATTIDGRHLAPVITLIALGFSNLYLENLKLINGKSTNGGGGIDIESSGASVFLSDMELVNNSTNTTFGGGGIGCRVDAFITLVNTKVNNNAANGGSGGGIYLSNGCRATIYSPSQINSNTASLAGGGIYLSNGASLNISGQEICDGFCIGSNQFPVEIVGNSAGIPNLNNDGGGIYIEGNEIQSTIYAQGVNISNNNARNGAGLYSNNNVSITFSKQSKNCWDNTRCNYFSNNKTTPNSTTNTVGGAIYNFNSELSIKYTVFEDNRADVATAIYTTGPQGSVQINSSLFNHNGNNGTGGWNDLYLLRSYNQSNLLLFESTIADNQVSTAVLGINNASINLQSSIIDDSNSGDVISITNPISQFFKCLIVHETNSTQGFNITHSAPNFVDRVNRNYHLTLSSPAIDYCGELYFFTSKDIDFESRGVDDSRVNDSFTGSYWDIGMDEYIDEFTFLIFKDSFEN